MAYHWTDEQKAKACEEVLAEVAKGRGLNTICKRGDDWLPSEGTFRYWCDSDADLSAKYARARETRADVIFDECLEIADQYDQAAEKAEGGTDHINRARLRIDTRKWMAGKLRPRAYGDKIAIGGAEDLPPVEVGLSVREILGSRIDAIKSRAISEPKPE